MAKERSTNPCGPAADESPAAEAHIASFLAPRQLAIRWACSRTQVDRIARRAGLARYCFGAGRNGMVRYLRQEVEAYEAASRIEVVQ